jgi:hypothetical protein
MAKKEKYLELEDVVLLEDWYKKRTSTLQSIANIDEKKVIKFSDGRGNEVPLPDEHRKGFLMGLRLSLEIIGEFPFKIKKEK